MIKNAFTDILLYWGRYSDNMKLQRVQDLENMVARIYNRTPRRVKFGNSPELDKAVGEYRSPGAYYSRNDPNNIHILDIDLDPIEIIKLVVHEGYHALIHDFLSKKATLKTFSEVDREKFLMEEENLIAIAKYFDDRMQMPLFDSFFAEERLNHLENSIFISKQIIDSIENPFEAEMMSLYFILSLNIAASNEYRGKQFEMEYGIKYDNAVVNALNENPDEVKHDYSKCGKIRSNIDPEYLKFYKKVYSIYNDYYITRENSLINENDKNKILSNSVDLIIREYFEYIIKLLKSKKKI